MIQITEILQRNKKAAIFLKTLLWALPCRKQGWQAGPGAPSQLLFHPDPLPESGVLQMRDKGPCGQDKPLFSLSRPP